MAEAGPPEEYGHAVDYALFYLASDETDRAFDFMQMLVALTRGRDGDKKRRQRNRSNSSCDKLSCRRTLKSSGGPISRPLCSGMVTDRPSACVQRSWLPVWRRLTKRRHARFQSYPLGVPGRGPDALVRSKRTPARVPPARPRACPSMRSSRRGQGSRLPKSHRLIGKVRSCSHQCPWLDYTAGGRALAARNQVPLVRTRSPDRSSESREVQSSFDDLKHLASRRSRQSSDGRPSIG
jgi:hypothetical protein